MDGVASANGIGTTSTSSFFDAIMDSSNVALSSSSSLSSQFQLLPQVLLLLQKVEQGDEREVAKAVCPILDFWVWKFIK